MIEINLYRIRIGTFQQRSRKQRVGKIEKRRQIKNLFSGAINLLKLILMLFFFLSACCYLPSLSSYWGTSSQSDGGTDTRFLGGDASWGENVCKPEFISLGRNQTSNFLARYLHGNIKRGVVNMHLNIRSLYNKMAEVKHLVQQEKPHILGISESELRKSSHHLDSLKIPGYDMLLPKSWEIHGKARVVVYIKKSLQYDHLPELEQAEIQSIWLRAGFKNSKKIYYSHQYREHTNTLGNSMAAQRTALDKMLLQWEAAVVHGDGAQDTANEVHIAGDMNLDYLKGRWLESSYPLVTLGRMVSECCNSNNFVQMVNEITRIQYNSIRKETSVSCIDHLYCNAKYRISPVKVLPFGGSDHDAIVYTRFSKEPKPPSRTVRKRSYKNFIVADFVNDVASLDFTDVYCAIDVDEAASLLTDKLVDVLNVHAPWIVFQQRKDYVPWLTPETVKMMKERDTCKEQAKVMASVEGRGASAEQAELWDKFKTLRNNINNRIRQEEVKYKKTKVDECQENPSSIWGLAKKYMDWRSPGPPTQLEVEKDKKITLYTKAKQLAQIMNEFFISKVQNIVKNLKNLPTDLSGCRKVMGDRNLSISLKFVTVRKVRKLLKSLKNKTSSSIDQLDNYAVKLVADHIAAPLHHVITLSIMQQKFPTGWKYTKIVPLHKKDSQLKRENYRPVAILSPLSKVLEKIVYEHIYDYFSRNKLFHPSLHGYRKDRSTMTALLSMYDKWVKAASKGQVSGVVLVDLSAAFDLVSPTLLIQKLRIYGFQDDILNWISSYLTDRYQAVWIDHVFSSYLHNSIGVPQGSNLGPLFFLIFFNDLPNFIREDIDCYADDSTLGATAETVEIIGEKLSGECENLSNWMQSNSFKLNADKTHFLTMGTDERLHTLDNHLIVEMDGAILEENIDKFEVLLGVSMQGNLKWSEQIVTLVGKLKKRLTGLDKLRLIMNKKKKKNIVQGVFNSVLCYCLPLFGGCNNNEMKTLQVQQNRAARIVLNLPPRSNRKSMFEKLGWMTVQQLIAYHTLLSVFRIRQSKEPEYLARALTRDNNRGNIIVENSRLGLYKKSFVPRGATLWNNLPRELRNIVKVGCFKKKLRKWIEDNVQKFVD